MGTDLRLPPFLDRSLLDQALTHRSYAADHNERLEFLGDSVLGLCVSQLLYLQYPQYSEGELSRVRAHLVRQERLVPIAEQLGLPDRVRLGAGERSSGGATRPSILADALEAVIGALYLDQGLDVTRSWLESLFQAHLTTNLLTESKDPKTRLQEWMQGRGLELPTYTVVRTAGADHAQTFWVRCRLESLKLEAQAEGASRRSAEQAAAEAVWGRLPK